jgi:anti-sigma regulatory factor (Ser/Thr protein kinase)
MRELALHILDLVQNSIEAGATHVLLEIVEDIKVDILLIRVIDDGRGMDKEACRRAVDPFVTTRKTRSIGLGLPLIDMSTKQCGGYLKIESTPGQGTLVEAVYQYSHLDRPPLGKMVDTIKSLVIANPQLKFSYHHVVNDKEFSLETDEIAMILGGMPLTNPDVILWLNDYLSDNMANLYGGAKHENN